MIGTSLQLLTRTDGDAGCWLLVVTSSNAPESIEYIGKGVVYGCARLLATVKYKRDDRGCPLDNEKSQCMVEEPIRQLSASYSMLQHFSHCPRDSRLYSNTRN